MDVTDITGLTGVFTIVAETDAIDRFLDGSAGSLEPRAWSARSYDSQEDAESALMMETSVAVSVFGDSVADLGLRNPAHICEVWHLDNEEGVYEYLATYRNGDPVPDVVSALSFVKATEE